jgi:hypothetical protein
MGKHTCFEKVGHVGLQDRRNTKNDSRHVRSGSNGTRPGRVLVRFSLS